jgi:hypothetical protein
MTAPFAPEERRVYRNSEDEMEYGSGRAPCFQLSKQGQRRMPHIFTQSI